MILEAPSALLYTHLSEKKTDFGVNIFQRKCLKAFFFGIVFRKTACSAKNLVNRNMASLVIRERLQNHFC